MILDIYTLLSMHFQFHDQYTWSDYRPFVSIFGLINNSLCAYGPYCKLNPIWNGVYILAEFSIHILNMFPFLYIAFTVSVKVDTNKWLITLEGGLQSFQFTVLIRCVKVFVYKKKKEEVWQRPVYQHKIQKKQMTTQKRHQTLRFHNDCWPTGVVKPVCGQLTFPLAAK